MDIAVHLGFGASLNLQTTTTYDFIFTGISLANFRINSYMNFPLLSKAKFDLLLQNTPMTKKWRGIVANMVQARLKEEPDARHDLYSFVSGSLEVEAKDMQSSELFAESPFFLSADCYKRLAHEIRGIFSSDADIANRDKLKDCRYLRACINEALRMTPPLGGTLWREAADTKSQGPLVVDGHIIPRGTLVGVNSYSLYHNERYFPDPFTYSPDRWLRGDLLAMDEDDQADHANVSEMHQAFSPFSIGIRSCAGKFMAYLEASLIIAKVVWHFDFKQAPRQLGEIGCVYKHTDSGKKPEFHTFDAITSRHDGPYLIFVPRK